jgi:hypothetical protein
MLGNVFFGLVLSIVMALMGDHVLVELVRLALARRAMARALKSSHAGLLLHFRCGRCLHVAMTSAKGK